MAEDAFAPPRASLEVRDGPQALWEMPVQDLRKNYLASLVIHALGYVYGLVAFVGFAAVALVGFSIQAKTTRATDLVPLTVFLIMTLLVAVACVTSFTRQWGRWLGTVLCAIALLAVPVGTAIGILGIAAYLQGDRLFGRERLRHKDVAFAYKQRKHEK